MIAGLPDLEGADAVIMLADPYTFPVEPLLIQLASDFPGLPVIGGLASARRGPMAACSCTTTRSRKPGAVGAVLRGVDVRACVSQGARPIGPEMVITAADGQRGARAREPAGARAAARGDRRARRRGARAGGERPAARHRDRREPARVRASATSWCAASWAPTRRAGSVTVGDLVRVGQTARLQVRDGVSADEDLRAMLLQQRRELPGPPAGALVFTCNGRGVGMFGEPDHDAVGARGRLRQRAGGGLLLRGRDRAGRAAQLPARLHRDDGGLRGGPGLGGDRHRRPPVRPRCGLLELRGERQQQLLAPQAARRTARRSAAPSRSGAAAARSPAGR